MGSSRSAIGRLVAALPLRGVGWEFVSAQGFATCSLCSTSKQVMTRETEFNHPGDAVSRGDPP
jgi:hypothetical protein